MSENTENSTTVSTTSEGKRDGACEVCKQPTERKCSACKLVFYCNAEHQKEDWKVHKNKCRPFEIAQSKDLGRYLKAIRDLEPGDVIFSELPIVFGPKPHLIEDGPFPCVGCCRVIILQNIHQCPQCLWPACSPECGGLKDPFRHGLECRILKLRQPLPITPETFYKYFRFDILIIFRALFLQKINKTKWEQLIKLEDHLDKRGPGTDIFKIVDEKVKYIEEYYLKPLRACESGKAIFADVSSDLIHKIYAILDVNATELTEDVDAEILYPTASLIEHNCTPNSAQVIDETQGYQITFRAALPLKKDQHITSIYTHILWGTHARREHLKQTKYFACTCDRCKDPTELGTLLSALKCLGVENEPCGGTQLPIKPTDDKIKWLCDKCKIKLPNKEIMKFVEHLGGEVEKALAKQPTCEELEELLDKLLNFLHPNHYHVYAVKHSLVQLYSAKGTGGIELAPDFLKEKIKMCEEMLDTTKKIDPGNARLSLYLAVLLHELFEGRFQMLSRNYTVDDKDSFLDEIKELEGLLKENKKALQYDLNSTAGAKLFEVVCQNESKYAAWLKENDLTK